MTTEELRVEADRAIEVYNAAHRALQEAGVARNAALKALYLAEHGLTVESEVLITHRKGTEKGWLVGVGMRYNDVSPIVHMYKKDGTVGKRVFPAWRITSIRPVNSEAKP